MNPAPGSGNAPHRHNGQMNQANGGPLIANQGNQYVTTNNITNNHQVLVIKQRHARTGWAILVILAVDVAFFFYGQAAYTGRMDSTGDMWRAGIFLALVVITGSLIRRWVRTRI